MMIGSAAHAGSARRRRVSSRPSIPGSMRSSTTRSGAPAWSCASASRPSAAVRQRKPSRVRWWTISARMSGSSSTTRTSAAIAPRPSAPQQAQHPPRERRDGGRGGDGHDPRGDDASGHAPAHGREALGGAHAHDRAGDRVRGADGNAADGRADQRDGARRLRAEAADGAQLGDAHAHRLHDAPATRHRAEPHRGVRGEYYPERNVELRAEVTGREEQDGDDAHGLLGVVGPVRITHWSTMAGSTTPLPTVVATWTPKPKAATKLKNAAHTTACSGVSTRVETTVAIELAASWNPLMKSKTRATMTMKTTRLSMRAGRGQAILRMIPSMTFATSSQRSVTISIVS